MNLAAIVSECAHVYEHADSWTIPAQLREEFREHVDALYKGIGAPVRFYCLTGQCPQAFHNSGEMLDHWQNTGELLMLNEDSQGLGAECYTRHRAVHDWFGHLLAWHPFGIPGEFRAFAVHTLQYPTRFWPIVFSDVVLANCYWHKHGKSYGQERWVHAPELMGSVLDWCKRE